jgi:hypothetical protein
MNPNLISKRPFDFQIVPYNAAAENAASEQRLLAGSKCFLLHCERARAVHLCLVVLSGARSQIQSNLLQLLRIC